MEPILEQAKEMFEAERYSEGVQMVKQKLKDIKKEDIDIYYDFIGCCLSLMDEHIEADRYFNLAIISNPRQVYHQINKAASMINAEIPEGAQQILIQASNKINEPAIYYNLRRIYKNDQEKVAEMTTMITQFQSVNYHYDAFNGLVPSFLKNREDLPDAILKKDCQFLETQAKQFVQKFNKCQTKFEYEQFVQYIQEVKGIITKRQFAQSSLGIKCMPQIITAKQTLKKALKIAQNIMKWPKIHCKINFFRQRIDQYLRKLSKIIKQIFDKINQLNTVQIIREIDVFLDLLTRQISLNQKKQQIGLYDPKFYQQITNPNNKDYDFQIVKQSEFSINRRQISYKLTKNNLYFLVPRETVKQLNPLKFFNVLNKQQVPQEKMKIYLNMYWMTVLAIIFHNQSYNDRKSVIDRQSYFKVYQICQFIYSQTVIGDSKLTLDNFELQFEQILDKIDKFIYADFLKQEKFQQIHKNIDRLKFLLDELDSYFAHVYEDKGCLDFFSSRPQSESWEKFREYFGISENSTQNIIAQMMMILLYHMRKDQKAHKIIQKAYEQAYTESEEIFNGRESMAIIFCQFQLQNQKQIENVQKNSFLDKLAFWKKH